MFPTLAALAALAAGATPDPPADPKAFWQNVLDREAFGFDPAAANALHSLERVEGDAEFHLVRTPADRYGLTLKVVRGGKELLAVAVHAFTPFRTADGVLYVVQYPRGTTGCTVLAYDLATGKKLWATAVNPFAEIEHSAYRNTVTLALDGRSMGGATPSRLVWVAARESYGDYAAVLDRTTGAVLATKVYRKDFAPVP